MKKLCVLFVILLSSVVMMSCFSSRHGMKEKVFKQQLDSLISENDSLREEKGKLIYLICKLKGGGFDVHSKDERKNRDSLEDTIKSYIRGEKRCVSKFGRSENI